MEDVVNMSALRRLVKIHNETDELTKFIQEVVYEYEPKVDKLMNSYSDELAEEMLSKVDNPNRPLFSEATTKKILNHIADENILKQEN